MSEALSYWLESILNSFRIALLLTELKLILIKPRYCVLIKYISQWPAAAETNNFLFFVHFEKKEI